MVWVFSVEDLIADSISISEQCNQQLAFMLATEVKCMISQSKALGVKIWGACLGIILHIIIARKCFVMVRI